MRYGELTDMHLTRYDDLPKFLKAVDWIKVGISELENLVSQIGSMQSYALREAKLTEYDDDRDRTVEDLREKASFLSRMLIERTKTLESVSYGDTEKQTQAKLVREMLRDALTNYQVHESSLRQQYKQNVARQFRIVKPDATEEEIEEAAQFEGGQIFAQAMMTSNRRGEAASILGSVKSRHREIQKIEATMREIMDMMAALEQMIEVQGQDVEDVDHNLVDTEKNTAAATVHLQSAIKSARSARKCKRITALVIFLILVVIVVLLVLKFKFNVI